MTNHESRNSIFRVALDPDDLQEKDQAQPRPTTQGKPWGHSTTASMPLLWPSAEATRNPGLDDLNALVCLKADEYIYIYTIALWVYIYMYTHQYSYIMVMLEIWCWYWGEYGHSVAESVIFRCLKMELYLEHATRYWAHDTNNEQWME